MAQIKDHLFMSPDLARLAAHAQRLGQVQSLLAEVLPPALSDNVRVGDFNEAGELILLVKGNAAAAKLKQLVPRFEQHLRAHAIILQRVRVRVEVFEAKSAPVKTLRTVPDHAKAAFAELAERLPESSPLRESLLHFVARARDEDMG